MNKEISIAVQLQHSVSLAACEIIIFLFFFSLMKRVKKRYLSKTVFTIGWRMKVARLSFFLKEFEDK